MIFAQINSPFLFNIGNKTKWNPFIYRRKEFHLFLSQNQPFFQIWCLIQISIAAPQEALKYRRVQSGFVGQNPACLCRWSRIQTPDSQLSRAAVHRPSGHSLRHERPAAPVIHITWNSHHTLQPHPGRYAIREIFPPPRRRLHWICHR